MAAKNPPAGRVFAAEPTDGAYKRLVANVKRNEVVDKTIRYNGLIAESNVERKVRFVPGSEEYSSINSPMHPVVLGKAVSATKAPAATVDRLASEYKLKPALIKVDAEGAELLVFKGANQTLATHGPVIVSELGDELLTSHGANCREVVAFLGKFDYTATVPMNPTASPEAGHAGTIPCVPNEVGARK